MRELSHGFMNDHVISLVRVIYIVQKMHRVPTLAFNNEDGPSSTDDDSSSDSSCFVKMEDC